MRSGTASEDSSAPGHEREAHRRATRASARPRSPGPARDPRTRAAGHNVTNFVVMQQTANALLAVGASPIMAHAEAELDELLRRRRAGAQHRHARRAVDRRHGAALSVARGARFRSCSIRRRGREPAATETALRLLGAGGVTILRGNASEILALAGAAGRPRASTARTRRGRARRGARPGAALRLRGGRSGTIDYCLDGAREVACTTAWR